MDRAEIARQIGCSVNALAGVADMEGLTRKNKKWTEEEIRYLKENYNTRKTTELASRFGRCPSVIRYKAKELGLVKENTEHEWSDNDYAYIRANYMHESVEKMASEIGCTKSALKHAMRRLGIRKKSHKTL